MTAKKKISKKQKRKIVNESWVALVDLEVNWPDLSDIDKLNRIRMVAGCLEESFK